MRTLRDLLADGRVHVVDGAMGTMLYGRGVFLNVCYDELNLKQPDLVRDIHREYVRAGAELLETNTFGANPLKLAAHGLSGETERINIAAAAAGPRGRRHPRRGPGGHRAARRPGRAVRRALARRGAGRFTSGRCAASWTAAVDGFILETFSDVEELRAAVRAVRARLGPPDHRADDGRAPTARPTTAPIRVVFGPIAGRPWAPT